MARRKPFTRGVLVVTPQDDEAETLIGRARRLRGRGEERRALALLRQACMLDEWRSRPFALLGAWLIRAGQHREAGERLRHAQWLLVRKGEPKRARALDALRASAESRAA